MPPKKKLLRKKKRSKKDPLKGHPEFFKKGEFVGEATPISPYRGNVWTRNKAELIARYLRSFVYVTWGGTYIDAFAGPQTPEAKNDTWAAKLVAESQPKRLRRFYLAELDAAKIPLLENLKSEHSARNYTNLRNRIVEVLHGDANQVIPEFLRKNPILDKEPTFCLFDQRTLECSWELVETIANHKKSGHKIEIFYFLAQAWLDRPFGLKKDSTQKKIERWWGRSDWMKLKAMNDYERGECMVKRFREELGYKYSQAFPVRQNGKTGRIMFWMVHASDHYRAIPLMAQAFTGVGLGIPELPPEQLSFIEE